MHKLRINIFRRINIFLFLIVSVFQCIFSYKRGIAVKHSCLFICAAILMLCVTGCKTAVPPGGGGSAGPMVYYNFPAVIAERPDKTPKTVILKISAGYYDSTAFADEIKAKDAMLKTVIAEFGKSIDAVHLSDFSQYNDAHEKLKDMMNAKLEKGKIEKILFRKIEAQ